MKFLCVLSTFLVCVISVYGYPAYNGAETSVSQLKAGTAIDEVAVPLEIRALRVKRQGRRQSGIDSSQSTANAAANSQFFGKKDFGASAANAQAQGFETKGPLGAFGANAANTQTQSFVAGPGGIQGSAGASLSQVYKLPDGKTLNVAFSNGFAAGPGGISGSNANGVTIT